MNKLSSKQRYLFLSIYTSVLFCLSIRNAFGIFLSILFYPLESSVIYLGVMC